MSDGKPILVTGATRGLGYALAVEAARRQLGPVIVLGRTQGGLDDVADDIQAAGADVTQIPMDITDDDAIAYMAESLFKRFGGLGYWLHTAWFTAPMQPVPYLLTKDLETTWKTNIRATARLIHVLDPILRNTKGAKAVFFDDVHLAKAQMSNIEMSKTAQMSLVQQYQEEANKIGPIVQICTPPPMRGHLRGTLFPGLDQSSFAAPQAVASDIWDQLMG